MLVVASEGHRRHHPVEAQPFAGELMAPREVPARADAILSALHERGVASVTRPVPVDAALLARVHTEQYLAFLSTAHERWCARTGRSDGEARPFVRPFRDDRFTSPDDVLAQLGRFSHDTDPLLGGTWDAALDAVSCATSAAVAVLDGEPAAYALCRPPGHHATADSFGGYCYLNNVAVAAQSAVERGARVAILDVDAHAGNGTAHLFWERDDVLVVSIHADPTHEYPFFGGRPEEIGRGAGAGFTAHLPVPAGTGWADYDVVLGHALARVVEHRPDVVLVSLGVDTSVADGVLSLDGDDYLRLGERLAGAGLPLVLVQEGGYSLSVLGLHVANVLEGVAACS